MTKLTRAEFMAAFRDDETLGSLSPDDRVEMFAHALTGSEDLTKDLLDEVLNDYGVDNLEVIDHGPLAKASGIRMTRAWVKQTPKNNTWLVGIDLETGGLDGYFVDDKNVRRHGADYYPILEMGVVVTNSMLEIVDQFSVGIKQSPESIESMSEWAKKQHQKSGLVDALNGNDKKGFNHSYLANDVADAQSYVIARLSKIGAAKYDFKERTGSIIFGNNIGYDMNFMSAQMPELADYFHYRKIDISGIEIMARSINSWAEVGFSKPDKLYAHTALSDILESLAELKNYGLTLNEILAKGNHHA